MDKIINLGIPHIGEQIFASLETYDLYQCLKVSQTWKDLVGPILAQRLKGKMLEVCISGKTEIVQLLLEHCTPEDSGLNLKGNYGWTPFMEACYRGHKDIVKLLLDHSQGNIDLNTKTNDNGFTAFMIACMKKGNRAIVEILLSHSGIDFNIRDTSGRTAFLLACIYGHRDIVELLLGHSGIEFNVKSNCQKTAFMMACENGHLDVVQLMLAHQSKIDINVKGPQGWPAFWLDVVEEHMHKKVMLHDLTVFKKTEEGIKDSRCLRPLAILLEITLVVIGFVIILANWLETST